MRHRVPSIHFVHVKFQFRLLCYTEFHGGRERPHSIKTVVLDVHYVTFHLYILTLDLRIPFRLQTDEYGVRPLLVDPSYIWAFSSLMSQRYVSLWPIIFVDN